MDELLGVDWNRAGRQISAEIRRENDLVISRVLWPEWSGRTMINDDLARDSFGNPV